MFLEVTVSSQCVLTSSWSLALWEVTLLLKRSYENMAVSWNHKPHTRKNTVAPCINEVQSVIRVCPPYICLCHCMCLCICPTMPWMPSSTSFLHRLLICSTTTHICLQCLHHLGHPSPKIKRCNLSISRWEPKLLKVLAGLPALLPRAWERGG